MKLREALYSGSEARVGDLCQRISPNRNTVKQGDIMYVLVSYCLITNTPPEVVKTFSQKKLATRAKHKYLRSRGKHYLFGRSFKYKVLKHHQFYLRHWQ